MKIPKAKKRYCPKCKHHTEQTVSLAKSSGRSKAHPMSRGAKARMRRRGLARGYGNKGRLSRPYKPKMTGAKTSKKVDLRFKCKECGKMSVQNMGFRVKRPEIK